MDRNVYKALLEFCEIPAEEVEELLPDFKIACDLCKLSEADVAYALDEYIPANWDVQYQGVRLMIGAYMRELVEIGRTKRYKEEGVKLIYGILPAIGTPYNVLKKAAKDKAYIGFPDLMMVTILNGFFHKASSFFNSAEQSGFTYGCRHCPLNKMRVAAYTNGVIPSPDVIWSWGFNCDEGPKTDEMIQLLLNDDWNYVISRMPHDTAFGSEDDEDASRVKYVGDILKADFEKILEKTGIEVKEEDWAATFKDNQRLGFKIGTISSIICQADPPVIGGASLTNLQQVMTCPFNSGTQYMEKAIDVLTKELRKVVKAGEGILPKGSPKIGSYFVPFCIPWIDRLFRENGISTTFSDVLSLSSKQLQPSNYKNEMWMSTAEQWLRMGLVQNMGYEIESMIEKVNTFKPDGMLMGFFDFDRWLGAHHKIAAQLVEKETGVKHYYMEADFWDDRDYSEEALRTRIESMSQIIKMRKEQA
ncbi:MAG: 2-hydroxyacyl-CoA dehydratase [Pleomorphochaeta sp.]